MKALRLTIKGRVQGVFYRAHAQSVAKRLGLTGWIRNNPTGEVSALVQGRPENVQEFVAWCHKGSPWARVSKVEASQVEFDPAYEDFNIHY